MATSTRKDNKTLLLFLTYGFLLLLIKVSWSKIFQAGIDGDCDILRHTTLLIPVCKGDSYFKFLVVNSPSKTTGGHQCLDSCLCWCVVEWLTDEWLHFKDNSLWLAMNTIQKKDSNCWCSSKTFSFDIEKVFEGRTCSVWKYIRLKNIVLILFSLVFVNLHWFSFELLMK
jgi:hypothetical protein